VTQAGLDILIVDTKKLRACGTFLVVD